MEIKQKQFFLSVLFSLVCCIVIGLIFFQGLIFEYRSPRFMIVFYGLAGSIIYSSLEYRSIKESIFYSIILLIINVIFYKAAPLIFVYRDIILMVFLWAGLYFYRLRLTKMMVGLKYIRSFALGIVTGIFLLAAGLILVVTNVPLNNISLKLLTSISYLYLQSGMLIGLGVGLGHDLANYFISKNKIKELSA